jgi:hypothetical protein
MAFMNQERKAERAPAIKAILKKYGMKGSLSVRNYSTLALKIKDVRNMFAEEFAGRDAEYNKICGLSINPYWFEKHFVDKPEAVEMFKELTAAMYGEDYFDESDAMTDYFHTSHYIDINVYPA